jgi:hypothetical protein
MYEVSRKCLFKAAEGNTITEICLKKTYFVLDLQQRITLIKIITYSLIFRL